MQHGYMNLFPDLRLNWNFRFRWEKLLLELHGGSLRFACEKKLQK